MVVTIYRIARWCMQHRIPIAPLLLKGVNRVLFGVVLPPTAELGVGVVMSYQGLGTVIHKRAVLGDGVIVATGVTIGGRSGSAGVPVIGAGAMIGSGAKILGDIHIGRFASIGANAVVLSDVPDYGVAVGVPAKVIRINRPEDLPDYRSFEHGGQAG